MNQQLQSDDLDFLTKVKFSKLIEQTVSEKNISYIDAIVYICEKYNIEIEDSRKYVSNVLKSKIEAEAMELNFLPRGNQLPIE
jgi:hypothetical protein